jgi:hypothetical protein
MENGKEKFLVQRPAPNSFGAFPLKGIKNSEWGLTGCQKTRIFSRIKKYKPFFVKIAPEKNYQRKKML